MVCSDHVLTGRMPPSEAVTTPVATATAADTVEPVLSEVGEMVGSSQARPPYAAETARAEGSTAHHDPEDEPDVA